MKPEDCPPVNDEELSTLRKAVYNLSVITKKYRMLLSFDLDPSMEEQKANYYYFGFDYLDGIFDANEILSRNAVQSRDLASPA